MSCNSPFPELTTTMLTKDEGALQQFVADCRYLERFCCEQLLVVRPFGTTHQHCCGTGTTDESIPLAVAGLSYGEKWQGLLFEQCIAMPSDRLLRSLTASWCNCLRSQVLARPAGGDGDELEDQPAGREQKGNRDSLPATLFAFVECLTALLFTVKLHSLRLMTLRQVGAQEEEGLTDHQKFSQALSDFYWREFVEVTFEDMTEWECEDEGGAKHPAKRLVLLHWLNTMQYYGEQVDIRGLLSRHGSSSNEFEEHLSPILHHLFQITETDEKIQIPVASIALLFRCRAFFASADRCATFIRLINASFYEFVGVAFVALLEGFLDPRTFYPADLHVLVIDILPRYFGDDNTLGITIRSGKLSMFCCNHLGFGAVDEESPTDSASGVVSTPTGTGTASRAKKRKKCSASAGQLATSLRNCLLATLAPTADCSIDDVVGFFAQLPLQGGGNYEDALRDGGIDGEVLFDPDLGRTDLFDMGIKEFDDVELTLSVLAVARHFRAAA